MSKSFEDRLKKMTTTELLTALSAAVFNNTSYARFLNTQMNPLLAEMMERLNRMDGKAPPAPPSEFDWGVEREAARKRVGPRPKWERKDE